jgi:hypothetical protein
MKPNRRRHTLRLAATIVCVIATIALLLSTRWGVSLVAPTRSWGCLLEPAHILLIWTDRGFEIAPLPDERSIAPSKASWSECLTSAWKCGFFPDYQGISKMHAVRIPLASLWLVSVLLTVLGWRSERLAPSACKDCGYDLTGNTSGRCPECGTITEP